MRPTSRICVMTRRMASKVSDANIKIRPRMLMLTSPKDAIAVPSAMSTTATIKRLLGSSSRAMNKATMVITGVNACKCTGLKTSDWDECNP